MTVHVATDSGSDKTHEHGTRVDVVEGHLFVLAGEGNDAKAVAVYAPNRWRRAEVKDPSTAAS